MVGAFKLKIKEELGKDFPEDPHEQLWGAIGAVFGSWMNQRAITYRKLNDIPADWGTAVNVQSMVFGNMGDDCATGVAFTRDPSTGENYSIGEFLVNAQGEDVVAGIRTPQPINRVKDKDGKLPSMEEVLPECYRQLVDIRGILEKHYKDMQDIEFTIEKGKLFMLQTRNGKRTAPAAIKIAVDMEKEGLIDEKEAVLRVQPSQLDQLLHPSLDPNAESRSSPRGCRPLPAPFPARWSSAPTRPRPKPSWARRSSWCASKPARGYPRHARRPGDPHRPRRDDLPRGGRCPRHGKMLRGRLWRYQGELCRRKFVARKA